MVEHAPVTTTLEALMLLATAYPNAPELSDETTSLYERSLDDIPPRVLETAVLQHIAQSKWFPAISELRDLSLELGNPNVSAKPSGAEAWGEVQRAIGRVGSYGKPEFSHPLIKQTVASIGWQLICQSETPGVERAHFLRMYEQLEARALSDARLLPEARELKRLVSDAARAAMMSGKQKMFKTPEEGGNV